MATKILMLNVNDLNDATKRRNLMKFCVSENCDAFLLQETHGCEGSTKKWALELQNMAPGKSLRNNFTHKERGVAILIKKEIEINEVTNDKRGRILAANFYLHETIF